MGDLISRKRLLEHISAWQQANAGAETQTEYAVIESCYRMAQNFPAGYDVEAVVSELEKARQMHEEMSKLDPLHEWEEYRMAICYKKAIEIVKRGGKNDRI